MKPVRFASRKSLLVLLVLSVTVLSLPLQVNADSAITIDYGTASHVAAPPFTLVSIEGDPTQIPYYDIENWDYYFDEWKTPYGHEYLLELLADRYSFYTTFTMPDYPVHFIAHYQWVERPGEPNLLQVDGIENGIVLYWNPPDYGSEPTGYMIEDGYDYYEVAADIRSFAITDMTNGKTYSINLWAVYGGTHGRVLNFPATAGPVRYQVHFDPANGASSFAVDVNEGYLVARPADPTREGHRFKGWYQASDPSVPVTFDNGIYADQYYVAVWEKIETFTVSFDSGEGSAVAQQIVEKNKPLVPPAEPKREGYQFDGWFLEGTRFDLATAITRNLTLTAQWKEVAKEKFTVTFDSRGGSPVSEQKVEENKTLVLPAEPKREGFRFGGWFRDDRRFDATTPVTEDFTLTAYWTALCPEIDMEALVGKTGQLDGLLCQAIGLSGSYDPTEFQVSLGPLYPSIQLTLRDLPGAAIIFSNPVRLRHQEAEDRVQNYASRFDAKNLFDEPIQARELNWLPTESADSEIAELSYVLQFADQVLLAKDSITPFKSSDGLIHLRYPEAEEEYALERFEALLETVVTTEGQRPALSYARFNRRQKAPATTADLLYTLGRLEHFLAEETEDRHLNAELLELAFQAAVADSQALEATLRAAGLTKEQAEDLAVDVELLSALGLELRIQPDDTENPVRLRALAGPFFARAKDLLPEDYQPLLEYVETQEAKLRPELPVPSDQYTESMLAFTDLALQIENCPAWRDPIWNLYAAELADAFRAYLLAHRTADGQLDSALQQSYGDYLRALNELDLGLPAGVLSRRIGAYRDVVLALNEQISTKGAALSEEELGAFLSAANLENGPPAEGGDG